jgi:ArsR family transcriptional regulator
MAQSGQVPEERGGQETSVALLKTLADGTRLRLVRVLSKEELNVQELSRVLQVAQPSVSRHLAVLRAGGLVADRREGNRVYYELRVPTGTPKALQSFIADIGSAPHPDLARLEDVLADRARESTRFADRSASCWDDLGRLLQQSSALLTGFAELVPSEKHIGDFGTGTGLLLPFLSRMGGRVFAVDQSSEMLRRARRRCEDRGLANVTLVHRSLEELAPSDLLVGAGVLHFVLHQVASPATVLQHLREVLEPGGRLVIIDRLPHEDQQAAETFGSLWLGFAKEQIREWGDQTGLDCRQWVQLPASETGDGRDEVFVAVLVRSR